MQVTISEISPVEKRLAVEIPWPYVARKLDEAYKDLSRGVALRGFRKGKVPRPMLEKLYGQRVEHDVIEKLVQESFFTAAAQHELQVVAEPVVDDVKLQQGQPFHYSARVEVRSVVEPKEYDGVELQRRKAKITDEQVDQAVERKRGELTQFKTIEGRTTLAATDIAILNVKGTIGDKPFEKEAMMIDLSSDERSALPRLGEALVGVAIDAKDHEVSFVLPTTEEDPTLDKELSGLRAVLKTTIREAREKQVPALDDELAKDTGEAETLAELRDKLRQRLLDEDEKAVQQELKNDLVKELLTRNSFVVAPKLVERQIDMNLRRARLGMAMQGIDYRSVEGEGGEQRLRDDLREGANDEIRAAFLLDAIAEKEKVEVTDADLEKRLAEIAQSRNVSVPRLKAELQKEGRLEGVRHSVREEKTLDLLLTRARITEKAG